MMSEILGVEKVLERLTLKRAIIEKSNLWEPIYDHIATEAEKNRAQSCYELIANNEPMAATDVGISNMTPVFITPIGCQVQYEMTGYLVSYPEIRQNYILRDCVFVERAHFFWQMIWEKEPLFIVMLTTPVNKAQLYFPANEKERLIFGPFTITCTKRDATRGYITRTLTIRYKGSEVLHTVTHIQCMSWGFLPPDAEPFGQFLDHLNNLNALWNASIGSYFPTWEMHAPVIQCNSGMGRTGCLVIINVMSRLLGDRVRHKYNIEKMMLKLKTGLPRAIETVDEYKFIVNQVIWETEKLKPEFVLGRDHMQMVTNMARTYDDSENSLEKLISSKKWIPTGAILDYKCFRKAVNMGPQYKNVGKSKTSTYTRLMS